MPESDFKLQISPGTVTLRHNGSPNDVRGAAWTPEAWNDTVRTEYFALGANFVPAGGVVTVALGNAAGAPTFTTPTEFYTWAATFLAAPITKLECVNTRLP